MKLKALSSTVLMLCFSLPVISVSAQQPEKNGQALTQVKIESFDWYAAREVLEPRAVRTKYRQGFPEGKSANFPTVEDAPQKDSEKIIYRIKIRNLSAAEIASVVWRYEFVNPLTNETAASIEFESRVRIKPSKQKTIYAESLLPPAKVVDINLLLLNKEKPFLESATVKSVVFKAVTVKDKKIRSRRN